MFQYTLKELHELKRSTDILNELERKEFLPLTPELLGILVKRNLGLIDPNMLFEDPGCYACACLGSREGEPLCHCVMNHLEYRYRYDIAIKLVELNNVRPYDHSTWTEEREEVVKRELDEQECRNAEADKLRDILGWINSDGRVVKR